MDHVVAGALLETRRVGAEDEDRTLLAVTDQPNARPDIDRLAQAVAALGNQHDARPRPLGAIDRLLQGVRVVGHAVGVGAERFLVKSSARGSSGRCGK